MGIEPTVKKRGILYFIFVACSSAVQLERRYCCIPIKIPPCGISKCVKCKNDVFYNFSIGSAFLAAFNLHQAVLQVLLKRGHF